MLVVFWIWDMACKSAHFENGRFFLLPAKKVIEDV